MTLLGILVAAIPIAFGAVRFVTTGSDQRYLWAALASLLGAVVLLVFHRSGAGPTRLRTIAAVMAAAASTALTAVLEGATAGPAVAVVSIAFGLCSAGGVALVLRGRAAA